MDPESESLLRYGEIIRQLLNESDEMSRPPDGGKILLARKKLDALLIELKGGVVHKGTTDDHASIKSETVKDVVGPDGTLENLETVRLRMVGALLAESSEKLVEALELNNDLENGATISMPSGLTYSKVAGRCVVLLPTFENDEQVRRFGSDMIDVYDCALGTSGIVFDCSAVKKLPFVLQGLMLGYKHSFALLNKTFSVVWLHKDALPKGAQVQIAQAFAAGELGPFLFSL